MFRNHTPSRATQGLRLRLAAAGLAALAAVLVSGPSASAAPSWSSSSFVVPLTSAEGIAAGAGYTFYQGELFTGDMSEQLTGTRFETGAGEERPVR